MASVQSRLSAREQGIPHASCANAPRKTPQHCTLSCGEQSGGLCADGGAVMDRPKPHLVQQYLSLVRSRLAHRGIE
jgi:hypothetical protein